jgi:hypothetical protein
VVFGPLHRAISRDWLPQRDHEFPLSDLSDRRSASAGLRKRLIEVAHEEHWSEAALERALRDGGPDVANLRKELRKGDPLSAVLKAVLKSVRSAPQ